MAHAGSCLAARLQPRNDAELKRHALGAALVGSSPTTPRCECNSGQARSHSRLSLAGAPFRAAHVSERSSDAATQQEGTWRTQGTTPRHEEEPRNDADPSAMPCQPLLGDRHPPRRRATATLDRSFTLAAQLGRRPFRAAHVSERSSDAATQQEGTWRTQSTAPPARRALSKQERGARRVPLRDTKRNRAMTPCQGPIEMSPELAQ